MGTQFKVTRDYFNLHSCCRYNHAAADALWLSMEQYSKLQDHENIAHINFENYFLAAELTDPKPRDMLAARFSIPFALASIFTINLQKFRALPKKCLRIPKH